VGRRGTLVLAARARSHGDERADLVGQLFAVAKLRRWLAMSELILCALRRCFGKPNWPWSSRAATSMCGGGRPPCSLAD